MQHTHWITEINVRIVKKYLTIPNTIEILNIKAKYVSDRFCATRSLVGAGVKDIQLNVGQRAISVEEAAINIIQEEIFIRSRINKLYKRLELFNQAFTLDELKRLKSDLYADKTLLKRACKHITEIDYYLEQHYQARVNKMIAQDDHSLKTYKSNVNELTSIENDLEVLFG